MSISTTSNVVFDVSRFCSQLTDEPTVGSKVTDEPTFMRILTKAMASHDKGKDEVEGQHYVQLLLTGELLDSVSCGVGERFGRIAADYCTRDSRGVVGCYLKRKFALPVSKVVVIVYTLDAYRADTDVSDEEFKRVTDFFESKETAYSDAYVIVAVLASYGSESPLSPRRFAANFKGNKVMSQRHDSILTAIESDGPSELLIAGDLIDSPAAHRKATEIELEAKKALRLIYEEAAKVTDYDEKFCVVAD